MVSPNHHTGTALYSESRASRSQTGALASAQPPSLRFQRRQKLTRGFLNIAIFVSTTRGGRYLCSWIFCLDAGHGNPWVAACVHPPHCPWKWRKLQLQLQLRSRRKSENFTLPGSNSPLLLRPQGHLAKGESSKPRSHSANDIIFMSSHIWSSRQSGGDVAYRHFH